MQRHRFVEQPRSFLAVWARRLAVFSLPVVLLAIIMARAGTFEAEPILVTFGASLVLAVLAILLAVAALVGIWFDGRAGAGFAFLAIAISLVLLAYPAYFAVKGYRLPAINDIATDPYDPPRLDAAQRLRNRTANTTVYGGLPLYQRQNAAYPDLQPLSVDGSPLAAYDAAYAVITKRKWTIVDARPPRADRRDAVIEAVARTPILGFRDDVVVRIRPAGSGARIDARSASRYGFHDFGTNAARLISLLDDIDDAIVPPPETPDPKKAAKPGAKSPAKPGQPPARR